MNRRRDALAISRYLFFHVCDLHFLLHFYSFLHSIETDQQYVSGAHTILVAATCSRRNLEHSVFAENLIEVQSHLSLAVLKSDAVTVLSILCSRIYL